VETGEVLRRGVLVWGVERLKVGLLMVRLVGELRVELPPALVLPVSSSSSPPSSSSSFSPAPSPSSLL